jgi:hypothetical protein
VVKDVQPNESGIQVAVVRGHGQVGISDQPTVACVVLL